MLPTDRLVAKAIMDRKKQFVSMNSGNINSLTPHEMMGFNHVCIVLDHAEKLFNTPVDQWISIDKWSDDNTTNKL